MKKTTQNVTKSICLSGLLAFVFLFSLSINSQTAGQEYLVNPGVNSATGADSTTPDTGVDGSGNMPDNLGGWTGGAGGAYAPATDANGDCHSPDRMFKFNKVGGAAGHYVYQDVEDLPAGNFNWSFYTRWGAVVDYDADDAKKPTFTILTDDDADGTWEVVETIITTQPTAANTWVEQTGAFENDYPRDVRIRFHKDGGSNNAPSNLNQLMFIDDVSLKYDSEITYDIDDTTLADLTIDGAIIAGFLPSKNNYDIVLGAGTTVVPTVAATTNNTSATAVITAATSIPGTTTILITAEDGTTTNTVSINFSLPGLPVVGQEYLVNPNINTTATSADTGVNGGGNMPANLGGWTGGVGGAYAPTSALNGDCQSEDRMFKFFKVGGVDGHYVFQDVEDLPAGNFNWSFYTRWGALVDYDAGDAKKPTFTILTDDDADGTWEVVKTIITTLPTVANTWVEQTGTFENDTPRDVRIRFHKDGGSSAAPSNLNQLMYIDDVSLKYDSEITYDIDDTTLADLTIDGAIIAGFLPSKNNYDIVLGAGTTVVPTVAATTNNTSATAEITAATSIPGTTTILITAENGTTTNTVSINFSLPALGVVGQEYLVNPNINTTATSPDTGVDGGGNMPANLGGWGSGAAGSYAPASAGNGNCHSEDRMFKFFKKLDSYVTQTVTLPAGTYDWSFWTRWAELVTWAAEGDVKPKFTIMTDDDADGTWEVVKTIITTQPTAVNAWVQQTGTFENDSYRQVRIKFSKSGGTDTEPTNLQELMYIDDVSLIFASSLSISEEELMSFSISPNPATDLISISGVENIKSIKVYSILGSLEKEVFNTNQIDISELSSGIHLIKVDNGRVATKKIIKQ
jgi:hypothetical protein